MSKYIDLIPKTLQQDFINKNVVPIVGAGFSKNGDMPNGVTMPDWNELGEKISKYINDYQYTSPIDAFSLFENEFSRTKLIELLSQELHINEIKPSKTYDAFCDVFFDVICTTNFDFLLEETLQNLNRPYSVINNEEKLGINIKDTTKLVKIHGDFNSPSNMVITEKDYDLFLSNNKLMSTYLSNLFITKTMFLVGYSFDDNDIRNVWQIINNRLGNLKKIAYCVLVDANKSEVAKFERRNIKVINLPGNKKDYPIILRDFFREIKELISANNINLLVSNDNKIKEELLLPNELNKMCYVAAPYQKLSQLKEFVFPILSDISITPIALDDILYPLDNWLEKSQLVIKKSKMALVDISHFNSNVNWEINMLYRNNKNIIFISDVKKNNILDQFKNEKIITYSSLDDERFLEDLKYAFSLISSNNDLNTNEALRLFNKCEYNAAAIASFRQLEEAIHSCKLSNYPMNYSLNKSLLLMINYEIIFIDYKQIKRYVNFRNQLVHSNYSISKQNAKWIIDLTNELIKQISNYKYKQYDNM